MSLKRHGESSGNVLAVSLFCACLCSFTIEGRVLSGVAGRFGFSCGELVLAAMAAHVCGLLSGGLFVRDWFSARRLFICGCLFSLPALLPFFFSPSTLWYVALLSKAYICGLALAAWGAMLRTCTQRGQRFRVCADLLILTAVFVSFIYAVMDLFSPFAALALDMFFMAAAAFVGARLPAPEKMAAAPADAGLLFPAALLCIFILIFTINSGLMYQVVLPAFGGAGGLANWYWNVPYVAAIAVLRFAPVKNKHFWSLYVGIVMLMLSFVAFAVLGRGTAGFVTVNTLMLAAFGIFDLFWWSVIAEMLDYARNPAALFGVCLAANVGGVALGGTAGHVFAQLGYHGSNVALLAMFVICVALLLMPLLNAKLLSLLNDQTFLPPRRQDVKTQTAAVPEPPLVPLTKRESDVFRLLLERKSNAEIAAELCLTENTIKTHVRNILAKYEVPSRKELFCKLAGK